LGGLRANAREDEKERANRGNGKYVHTDSRHLLNTRGISCPSNWRLDPSIFEQSHEQHTPGQWKASQRTPSQPRYSSTHLLFRMQVTRTAVGGHGRGGGGGDRVTVFIKINSNQVRRPWGESTHQFLYKMKREASAETMKLPTNPG
jgi:hypothetical protein